MRNSHFLGLALIMLASVGCGYNDAVSQENGLRAQWENGQSNHDNMWKQISQVASVAETERESFNKVWTDSMEGRYGDNGSQAVVSFITEAAPNPSPELYIQVQRVIEARRNDFTQEQEMLLDRKRAYQTHLDTIPNGPLLRMFGFPKALAGCPGNNNLCPPMDQDGDGKLTVLDYPVVTSSRTAQAFATGKDDDVSVFSEKKPAEPTPVPAAPVAPQ